MNNYFNPAPIFPTQMCSSNHWHLGICVKCPVCTTPAVYFDSLPTTVEKKQSLHFVCEQGHRWFSTFTSHDDIVEIVTERDVDEAWVHDETKLPVEIFTQSQVHDDGPDVDDEPEFEVARRALPKSLRWVIFEKFDYTCQYCKRRHHSSRSGPDNQPWHIDHVHPLSRGGVDGPENLTLSCARCNLRKQARHPADFRP